MLLHLISTHRDPSLPSGPGCEHAQNQETHRSQPSAMREKCQIKSGRRDEHKNAPHINPPQPTMQPWCATKQRPEKLQQRRKQTDHSRHNVDDQSNQPNRTLSQRSFFPNKRMRSRRMKIRKVVINEYAAKKDQRQPSKDSEAELKTFHTPRMPDISFVSVNAV